MMIAKLGYFIQDGICGREWINILTGELTPKAP